MSEKQNTKKGVAAIYVVVFTTMLIGIITLSFLRIMLSESGRTLNDTLSDSAYNAALAGVEDAKYVISQYETKIAANETATTNEFVKRVEESAGEDCDIIRAALDSNKAIERGEESIGADGSFQDQAYTCVTINLKGNFKGQLSNTNPTLVVPLRPEGKDDETVDNVEYLKVSWVMGKDVSGGASSNFTGTELQNLIGAGLKDGANANVNNENVVKNDVRVLGQKGVMSDGYPTEFNGVRAMLVQSPASGPGPVDYYASEGGRTNRGTLMLLASSDGYTDIKGKSPDNTDNPLVQSADKNLNAPIPVICTSGGACVANIYLPKPKGDTTSRDPDNFFLVLNSVYSEPSITVTVEMYNNSGKQIPFYNIQPIIDSTGRSGDLFRRVEARVGTNNGASLIPTAELSSNGDIDKSFYVTKNCINGTVECKD